MKRFNTAKLLLQMQCRKIDGYELFVGCNELMKTIVPPVEKSCASFAAESHHFSGDVSDGYVHWLCGTRRHQGTKADFVSALRITASRLRQTSPENVPVFVTYIIYSSG